jgi:hypothetical protein
MVIIVDFDGTCVTHDYPEVGKDIGAQSVLRDLVSAGHRLVLFTMRDKKTLADAERWFSENDIPLYGSQRNPEQCWTTSPKAYGQIHIDDAALGCPLKMDESLSYRPFVDWEMVRHLLVLRGVIKQKD